MFSSGPSSQTTSLSSSSSSSRRLTALIAFGGISAFTAATSYWMYRRRNNNKPKTNQTSEQMRKSSSTKTTNQKAAENAAMPLINSEADQSKKSESEKGQNSAAAKSEESVEESENVSNNDINVEETNVEQQTESEDIQRKDGQPEEVVNAISDQKNAAENEWKGGASIVEFIRGHISEPQFNWSDLVDAEEKKQREAEKKKSEEKKEGEEGTSTELTKEQKEEGSEEMLQHPQFEGGRQMYGGRGSIGSTTSGGRQHPVNSICTCECCTEMLNDLHSQRGYKSAESPHSTHSEGSADSGRATGPLTSYSPFAADGAESGGNILPIYEFEVPNTLVGLIIGIQGKTIKELCTRADVRMLIRPHHTPGKYETHQICSVEGRRENINKCLHMIRLRFPPCRFPDLNLKPVLPPPPTTTISTGKTVQGAPSALTLSVSVPCEVYISAHVDAGHFFVQLPTHPSFPSLALLDQYMLSVYTQPGGAPDLPKPCNVGVLCAAPAYNGWFRAITLAYDQDQDEMLVRFVDYGGFARLPRADLRQIRTDFMSLPLQGIECYLANVQPADGTAHWSDKANELFQQLCVSKIIQASLVGYYKNDGIPCVELHVLDENKKSVQVDQILLERGLAKPMDPTLLAI